MVKFAKMMKNWYCDYYNNLPNIYAKRLLILSNIMLFIMPFINVFSRICPILLSFHIIVMLFCLYNINKTYKIIRKEREDDVFVQMLGDDD